LSDGTLRPDRWTVQSIGERLEAGDPWEGMSRRARKLPGID
jgi:DNA primase